MCNFIFISADISNHSIQKPLSGTPTAHIKCCQVLKEQKRQFTPIHFTQPKMKLQQATSVKINRDDTRQWHSRRLTTNYLSTHLNVTGHVHTKLAPFQDSWVRKCCISPGPCSHCWSQTSQCISEVIERKKRRKQRRQKRTTSCKNHLNWQYTAVISQAICSDKKTENITMGSGFYIFHHYSQTFFGQTLLVLWKTYSKNNT